MLFYALLLGMCWFSTSTAVERSPGIVVRITPSALNSASDFGVQNYLVDYILGLLRGMNQTEKCIFGSNSSCSMRGVSVNNYVAPRSNVTFIRGKGIEWNLVGAACNIRFDFEIKATNANESAYVSGRASVQLSGISLASELTLSRGIKGRLLISLTRCSVEVPVLHSDVTITSRVSDSDTIDNLISSKLRGYLEDRVNKSLSTLVCNLGDRIAQTIPDTISLLNMELASSVGIFLDDTLVKEPTLETDYIEVAFRAEFRMVDNEEGASIQPHDLDLPPANSSMVGLYISDYVINTLYEVLFKKHLLSVNITKDLWFVSIYSYYSDLFDTSCKEEFCFRNIFPNISEKYPNSFAKFAFRVTSPPLTNFSRGAASAQVEFDMSIIIPEVNGSEVKVANLSMSVSKSPTLSFHTFSGNRVVGVVTDIKLTFTDRGSPEEFASFVPRLNLVMQTITDSIVVPWTNILGATGFPLSQPSYGICLFNTDIGFNPGFFRFSTDILYDPTTSTEEFLYLRAYSNYLRLFGQARQQIGPQGD